MKVHISCDLCGKEIEGRIIKTTIYSADSMTTHDMRSMINELDRDPQPAGRNQPYKVEIYAHKKCAVEIQAEINAVVERVKSKLTTTA